MKVIELMLLTIALLAFPAMVWAQHDISDGPWKITFDEQSKTLSYAQHGTEIVKGAYVEIHKSTKIHDSKPETLLSTSYPIVTLAQTAVSDVFGTGTKYTYTYSGLVGKYNIEQSFYIYHGRKYMLVEAALVAVSGTTMANYIAPIVSKTPTTFLPAGSANYIYDMPHDNDNWAGYAAIPFNGNHAGRNPSCEVSGAYNADSRLGLVVGSIEHDTWKSGITITPCSVNGVGQLVVAAGVVNDRTNDVQFKNGYVVMTHGSVSGERVRSPRYFFGLYTDWRTGFEDLGEAMAALTLKLQWNGGTIFAWQSWGGMAENVNYEGAVDVADFFKKQLMPRNFVNEKGVCYIVLDSYWDNMTDFQLRVFVQRCKANGQKAGIYHTPFSCWLDEEQLGVHTPYDGSPYKWSDIVLTANGKKRKIASFALDPTHPTTKEYNRRRFEKFKSLGFEYIKLDFINNGTLEADSYHDSNVTTGMQAYSYGMDYMLRLAQEAGMFVDLSISPVFPAKGHARRISCDSWGELDNSMYTLNSLNLGWWLDRLYFYNDPDHLVLSRAESEGAARIRYTMGAMTGTVLLGDNYSLKGSFPGSQAERDLALRIATNDAINDLARIGRSFRPVEGKLDVRFKRYQYSYGVDREFTLDTKEALYYVVFNYDRQGNYSKTVDFARIGIDPSNVRSIKELWTGQRIDFSGSGFNLTVPKADVRLYRIDKTTPTGLTTIHADDNGVAVGYNLGTLTAKASETIASIFMYDLQGRLVCGKPFVGRAAISLTISCVPGVYMVKIKLGSGGTIVKKILVSRNLSC